MISASEIRQTMRQATLRTVFQPLWDLRRGKVFGYEALSRFPAENPLRWFQAARRHGLEVSLNRFACQTAIHDFAPLAAEVPGALLFLNASSPASAVEIARIAERSPYASRIVLELTEELVAQAKDLVEMVLELRKSGLRLAVDDMGNGLSDRHRFHLMAPEVLKVDRRVIVRAMAGQVAAGRQLDDFIGLAESAGCYVLAEGIEREEWLPALAERGVALAQGFAFGHPGSAEEMLAADRIREPLAEARPAAPAAAELPDVLGEWVRRYLHGHLEDLTAGGEAVHGREGAAPQLVHALLLVLEEGTRPEAWHYGVSPELGRRIAAINAPSVEVAQGFAHLRGYLMDRLTDAARSQSTDVLRRMGDWLDALEIAVLRQRERFVVQREAFRDEELARRSRQTAILRELLTCLGEGRLDDLVAQRAAQLVGADEVALVLTSPDGAVRDMLTYPVDSEALRMATSAWLRHARSGADQTQHRVAGGTRRVQGPFAGMVSMPVAFDGERIGVLTAWRREPVAFSRRDCEALDLLVGQIAAALHAHSRLGEVIRREHELLVFEEMATALRGAQSPAAAARELLDGVRRLFPAESYFVTALNGEGIPATLAVYPPGSVGLARQASGTATHWVSERLEPLFLREGALALAGEGADEGLEGIRSVAVAPILAGPKALGAVGALDRRDRRIEAHTVETLERAAALFSLVQERFEREEELVAGR